MSPHGDGMEPTMKMTKNLSQIASDAELEGALTASQLADKFRVAGLVGFAAELDIAERTEEHVQMLSLDELLGFAKGLGETAVTYDVTYFPTADEAEVEYQLKQLSADLEISPEVIRSLCADEIEEYLVEDAKRDTTLPVHSIVEAYHGGTAFAWYGIGEYPRLKRIVLAKMLKGGKQAEAAFIRRASELEAEMEGF